MITKVFLGTTIFLGCLLKNAEDYHGIDALYQAKSRTPIKYLIDEDIYWLVKLEIEWIQEEIGQPIVEFIPSKEIVKCHKGNGISEICFSSLGDAAGTNRRLWEHESVALTSFDLSSFLSHYILVHNLIESDITIDYELLTKEYNRAELSQTLAHEIFHSFGLNHTERRGNIMHFSTAYSGWEITQSQKDFIKCQLK